MLGLYKALYDYVPQDPETELPLSEDQVIYILDKEDPECVSPRHLPFRPNARSFSPSAQRARAPAFGALGKLARRPILLLLTPLPRSAPQMVEGSDQADRW